MAFLGLKGPYSLDKATIDRNFTRTSPGNYALISVSDEAIITVFYIGRADQDLNARLNEWVGKEAKHTHFKADYASSVKDAFEKECQIYHEFGDSQKLDNVFHPDRPSGKDWECPVCKIFD